MKLSSYYKNLGWKVELKTDYENLQDYDKVTISKVFMDTEIPFEPDDKSLKTESGIADFYKDNPILNLPNVRRHPAVYRITVKYDGIEYTISGSDTYNKYKDKVGQNTIASLEIRKYDNGTMKYDIKSLQ